MTSAADTASPPAPPPAAEAALAALRGEIDRLDDQLHDLVMRRAEVVASLAASRVKGGASPLRPGREAMILRRLLARHRGDLPPGAWCGFGGRSWPPAAPCRAASASPSMRGTPTRPRLAREHFGSVTPVRSMPTAARALAAVGSGEAQVAVLPLPEEGEPLDQAWWRGSMRRGCRWWRGCPSGLRGRQPAGSLRRHPRCRRPERRRPVAAAAGSGRRPWPHQLLGALAAAGLTPRTLLTRRDGGVVRALAEVDGVVAGGDPRLAALPFDRALPLGFYAVPERGDQG